MIKAIIFDIDGTLIDSNKQHAESFVEAFAEFGKKVSYQEVICLIGMGANLILEEFLSKSEIEKFGNDLTDYRKKIFLNEYFREIKTFPKLRQLFEKLQSDGKKIALASSASQDELEKYKQKMKISDLFEEETNSDDTERAKPAPDIFEAAFKKLKDVEKSETLIIGDTPYDAEAANKAGIKIIGVTSGEWTREKLIDKGCFKVFSDLEEILDNYNEIFANK